MTRKHKQESNRLVSSNLILQQVNEQDTHLLDVDQNCQVLTNVEHEMNDSFEEDNTQQHDLEKNFNELFLQNLALFYLKLTAKHHVPVSTVQLVIQEMQSMHALSQNCLKQHIEGTLREKLIPEPEINDITEHILSNDIFNSVHAERGPLSTEYRRKQYYKEHFNYVNPISILLGYDKDNIKRYFEYVPIIETVETLLKDPSLKAQFINPILPEKGVLRDFMDGLVAQSNPLFIKFPNSIKLILYQDSFEIVNPLGSAKKKAQNFGCVCHIRQYLSTESLKNRSNATSRAYSRS